MTTVRLNRASEFAHALTPQPVGLAHAPHRVQQILGDHLVFILRREQRQARAVTVAVPLLRAEQAPHALLLQPVAEHAPRGLALAARQGTASGFFPVVLTEQSPVSEPVRLALVG